MSSRKRKPKVEVEEEKEEEEENEDAPPPKRTSTQRTRRPSARVRASQATGGGGPDDEETEDEAERPRPRHEEEYRMEEESKDQEQQDDEDEADGSGDDEGASKRRRRTSDSGKSRRRQTQGGSQHIFFSQHEIDTGGNTFTQAQDEAFLAEASQDTLRPQDERTFESLSEDQRKALIESTIRYIIMKGSQREVINRKKLYEDLMKEQKIANGVVRPVLKEAREFLEKTFGYQLVGVPEARFRGKAMQDSLFLISGLRLPGLSGSLHTYGKDVAFRGLLMVVLGLIYCAGHSIEEKALFQQLARLDRNLSVDTKGRGRDAEYTISGTVAGVGEAGVALERMRKELYVLREKGEAQDDGNSPFLYKLGPRAFVEVGRVQVITFLAETLGQSVDPAMLKELENEDKLQAAVAEIQTR